jgi:hypothetical protein
MRPLMPMTANILVAVLVTLNGYLATATVSTTPGQMKNHS